MKNPCSALRENANSISLNFRFSKRLLHLKFPPNFNKKKKKGHDILQQHILSDEIQLKQTPSWARGATW